MIAGVTYNMAMHVGFTGTRHGMTDAQRAAVTAIVGDIGALVAHHGDCVGADSEFHDLCRARGGAVIVIHPGPTTDADHAGKVGDERREPMNHMKRNKTIVMESALVIATRSRTSSKSSVGPGRRSAWRARQSVRWRSCVATAW